MGETFEALARRAVASRSARPLYLRLARSLERKLVAEGSEDLPSARGLAGELGINRATVNAAYRELARRGLVTVHRGRPARSRPAPQVLEGDAAPRALDLARYAPDRELLPHGDVFHWLSLGEGEGEGVAQYGCAWGYRPLRGWIADRVRRYGVKADPEHLLLTSGVQHALDLLLRVVTRPGDTVVVEDPTYPGLPPLLATHGLRAVGIEVTPEGIDPDAVAAAVRASGAPLAIVTPTLQNPTGTVLSDTRRRRLVSAMRALSCFLVEEYFDPALVVEGSVPPPLGALDGGVVMVGSFSKSLFPGLRVGWMAGPRELTEKVATLKKATDLSGSPLLEATAWSLCRRGVFDQQLTRLRRASSARLAIVTGALAAVSTSVSWSEPRGGFSLLLFLPEGTSSTAAAGRAAQRGIWLLPGPAVSVSGRDDILRIAFAAVGGERLQQGVNTVLGVLSPDASGVPLV